MLKVSPWKGLLRFGKKGKLRPRYIGPFRIINRVGAVAYRLELPNELQGIHNTFHVSNLKKYLAKEDVVVSLGEVSINERLSFIEEPERISHRKIKTLRNKEIPLVLVHWKFHKGPEATWEPEAEMRSKYPQLFG